MNQDLLKLKHLRDKVIGIEMQLSLTETDLIAVERDLDYLENLFHVLLENVTILKTDGIIAVASEYKKATLELKTVRENLSFYNKLHEKLTRDFDKFKKMYGETFEEFESLRKDIDSRKIILIFDPAKRKK
jgi:hypothetical protein